MRALHGGNVVLKRVSHCVLGFTISLDSHPELVVQLDQLALHAQEVPGMQDEEPSED